MSSKSGVNVANKEWRKEIEGEEFDQHPFYILDGTQDPECI